MAILLPPRSVTAASRLALRTSLRAQDKLSARFIATNLSERDRTGILTPLDLGEIFRPRLHQRRVLIDLYTLINTPLQYKTNAVTSETHESSSANAAYLEWRVVAKIKTAADVSNESAVEKSMGLLAHALLGLLTSYSIGKSVTLRVEADVSENLTRDAFKPCVRAINRFLLACYYLEGSPRDRGPYVVEFDTQTYFRGPDSSDATGEQFQMFYDHEFLIRGKDGSPDKVLVLVEEKKPKTVSIDELKHFVTKDGQGKLVKTAKPNIRRENCQLLKYTQTRKCPRTVLTDGFTFIGLEWEELDQSKMRHPGENKGLRYWNMQSDDGMPFRLSLLCMFIKGLAAHKCLPPQWNTNT